MKPQVSRTTLRPAIHSARGVTLWVTGLIGAALLAGCAALRDEFGMPTPGIVPAPLLKQEPGTAVAAGETSVAGSNAAGGERRIQVSNAPPVPAATRLSTVKPVDPKAGAGEPADITLAFDQQPLPAFVQLVFGQILKRNFSMDPTLLTRTDLVTLRTPSPQTASQVLETTRMLLKSYGVAVQEMGGFYRISPDSNQSAYLPEIRRGRAQPEVPLPLRPVFSLVEMSAVRASDVGRWVTAMFGTRVNVQEDANRNALLLSGQAADLTAALEAVQVLDQPLMRGRGSRLITPAIMAVDDLTRRLTEILSAEGYAISTGASSGPISFLPISASNALLVFATDEAVLTHVTAWAEKLDGMESSIRRGGNFFTYEVKYADAQGLAKTLQELLNVQQQQQIVPAGAVVVGASTQRQPARIVVNAATNTLIVNTSNPEDYAQLQGLMRVLDKPSKSVFIEVTVAEVRLGNNNQLGIEWTAGPTAAGSGSVVGGTMGGLSIGTGGLSLSYLNNVGLVRAKLNALASDNRARVLSTPRIMARNGEVATIQVGQEVPIITSQQSSSTASVVGGGAAPISGVVLQQIQYRSTGVILRVRPVIFAGRVELEVQQEVSSAASTSTGVNVSPTFSTRKIDTKLSIRDGATVALGGLISRNETMGSSGIPLLKDIPIAGQLFRTNTRGVDETELIILITPYVVDNDVMAEQVTQALRQRANSWTQSEPRKPDAITPFESPGRRPSGAYEPGLIGGKSVDTQQGPEAPEPASNAVPTQMPSTEQHTSSAVEPVLPAPALPTGVKVTDPALLDELRRAGGAASSATSPPSRKVKNSIDKKTGDKKPSADSKR